MRLRCDQNRKPVNNGRNKVKAVTPAVLSELFLMKKRAKDGTKGFSLLPTGFGECLVKHCGTTGLTVGRWSVSSVTPGVSRKHSNSLASQAAKISGWPILNVTEGRFVQSPSKFFLEASPLSKIFLCALSQAAMWKISHRYVGRFIRCVRLRTLLTGSAEGNKIFPEQAVCIWEQISLGAFSTCLGRSS